MTLSIRNPEADALAKRLAKLDHTTIAEAVIAALKEAIAARAPRKRERDGSKNHRAARSDVDAAPAKRSP